MINRDWVVELQFDGKKVEEGYRGLGKSLQKVNSQYAKADRYQRSSTQQAATKLRIGKEQVALQNAINRAVSYGMNEQQAKMHSIVTGSNNLNKLANRRLTVERWITAEKKKQAAGMFSRKGERVEISSGAFREKMALKTSNIDARMGTLNSLNDAGAFKKGEAQAYRLELDKLKAAKEALAGATTKLKYAQGNVGTTYNEAMRSSRALEQRGRALTRQFNAQRFAADRLKASIKHMAASYLSMFAVVAGGGAFYKMGIKFQGMEASLLAASGNAQIAGQNMSFLEQESRRLGVSLLAGVEGFNKLGIAARSQGYPLEEVRRIYTSIAESSAAFGLTAPKQQLVFLATSQMISKAKVSAEELRRQLGDSMPIAIEAMRRAYSDFKGEAVGMSEFTKAMEDGKIMSKDVMGGFATHLSDMARDGGALNAALQKLIATQGKALVELQANVKAAFGDEVVLSTFASGWEDIKDSLIAARPLFISLGRVMGTLFKGVAFALKTLAPTLNMVGNIINNLYTPFQAIADVIRKGLGKKALSPTERGLAAIGAVALYAASGFYYLLAAMYAVAGWFKSSDDDGMFTKATKSLISWGLAAVGAVAGLKVLGKAVGWLMTPFTALYKLIRGTRGEITKMSKAASSMSKAVKGGGLGSGFQSAAKNVGKSGGRFGLGKVIAPIGAGLEAGERISKTVLFDHIKRLMGGEDLSFMDYIRASNEKAMGGSKEDFIKQMEWKPWGKESKTVNITNTFQGASEAETRKAINTINQQMSTFALSSM